MEVFLLVVSLVVSILLLINGMIDNNIIGFLLGASYLISISYVVVFADRILNKDERKITPIEVYRGNTSLEIIYRDNIPVDSVVVWKK